MIIAIDFDGTCVTHEYPCIGKEIGAAPVLHKIVNAGHQLILWTMRSPNLLQANINTLAEAVNWFKVNEIPLYGINENPAQKASGWSTSNKQYAQLYIDDAALGCPLKFDPSFCKSPFVDWEKVEEYLIEKQIILG